MCKAEKAYCYNKNCYFWVGEMLLFSIDLLIIPLIQPKLLLQFFNDIDTKRTFTKIPKSKRQWEFAILRIFLQAFKKCINSNILCFAKILKSQFIAFKIFRAFHFPDDFLYCFHMNLFYLRFSFDVLFTPLIFIYKDNYLFISVFLIWLDDFWFLTDCNNKFSHFLSPRFR